jgi:hypothetical protein
MQSTIRHPYDGEASVSLSPASAGPYTAGTTNGASFDLKNLIAGSSAPYWASGQVGYKHFAVVIQVSAITVAGNETYSFSVETDSVTGFSDSPVTHMTYTDIGTLAEATGLITILVDVEALFKLDPDAKFLRLNMVAANGTGTASINYTAWAAPTL